MIKVTYRIEVPAGKTSGVCMKRIGSLPFVPAPGTMIVAFRGDDFREVEQVYWSLQGGFEVYFKFEKYNRVTTLRKIGWVQE